MRVGLVGYGSAGRGIHAPLIVRAGLELAAVSTSDATRAEQVRADHAGAQVVPDLEALLAVEGLGLVVLASPSGVHVEQAEQVIAAGLPLVVDKPLGVDASGALRGRRPRRPPRGARSPSSTTGASTPSWPR